MRQIVVGNNDIFRVSNYAKHIQYIDISGVGHYHTRDEFYTYEKMGHWPCSGTNAEEECTGLDPVEQRIFELEDEIAALRDLQNHVKLGKHHYDTITGICEFCGWDGNA